MSETIVELTSIQQAFIYSMEYGMIIIGFVCMVSKTAVSYRIYDLGILPTFKWPIQYRLYSIAYTDFDLMNFTFHLTKSSVCYFAYALCATNLTVYSSKFSNVHRNKWYQRASRRLFFIWWLISDEAGPTGRSLTVNF